MPVCRVGAGLCFGSRGLEPRACRLCFSFLESDQQAYACIQIIVVTTHSTEMLFGREQSESPAIRQTFFSLTPTSRIILCSAIYQSKTWNVQFFRVIGCTFRCWYRATGSRSRAWMGFVLVGAIRLLCCNPYGSPVRISRSNNSRHQQR